MLLQLGDNLDCRDNVGSGNVGSGSNVPMPPPRGVGSGLNTDLPAPPGLHCATIHLPCSADWRVYKFQQAPDRVVPQYFKQSLLASVASMDSLLAAGKANTQRIEQPAHPTSSSC
jgi:hypothetical protein